MQGVRHTRYGWWLEEAGTIEATAPLEGDTTADVVVVGGGYLGLWTAWQLKSLEPEVDVVVLEAGLAGHGPSGRNGGFVSTLWDDLPILRDRVGDERALEVVRASERGVQGIGAWCERENVDAWYRAAPTLYVDTSVSQRESPDEAIEACVELGVPEEVRPISADELRLRCDAGFIGGSILRTSATVHPARLAIGLRARAISAGVRLHERTAVRRLSSDAVATTTDGVVRAGDAVLAVNSATSGFSGFRLAHAVASSHMVVTEPVPDVIEELGWTGGEPIADGRTLLPTRGRRATGGSRSAGAAGGWASGRARSPGSRSIAASFAAPPPISCVSSLGSAAGGSPTPGAGRSTSPPRTCRSSAAAAAYTTGSASRGTASGRPTSGARSSPVWRSTAGTS